MSGTRQRADSAVDPGLRGYLGYVARQRPLTKTEESALARRLRDGDREALDSLVAANLRFVVRFVRRYRNRGLDDLDLIAAGTVGLIMAVRRSGWRGESRLVAVAVWWIQDAVRTAIGERAGTDIVLLPGGSTVRSQAR